MTVVLPSDAVLEIMRTASGSVLIAALLDTVSDLTCITRWLPEDIASGVCDIEIREDVTGRPGGRLFVQPHLHAKYYRAGDRCLVGSANLTGRGLGWVTPANVELLVELPQQFPGLSQWESLLLTSAVPATTELRDRIMQEADHLKKLGDVRRVPEVDQDAGEETAVSQWIPKCPVPDRLWDVYAGGGADTMVSSARESAQHDLAALTPPRGLTQQLFEAYIAGIMMQMPLMAEIDRLASSGMTDTEAHEFLTERRDIDSLDSANQRWRVLKAWLIHFFPNTYRLETGQEVLVKGKQLPKR